MIANTYGLEQFHAPMTNDRRRCWLTREKLIGFGRYAWFIPPVIGVGCALINIELNWRISQVAGYLQRIEKAAFGDDKEAPGWEHYKRSHRSGDLFGNILGIALWLLAFAGSVWLSWYCYTLPPLLLAPK